MKSCLRASKRFSTRVAIGGFEGTYAKAGLGKPELPEGLPKTVETGLFIGNEFVKSKLGKTFQTIDPATNEVICEVQEAGPADVDLAVAAAHDAFYGEWGKTGGTKRGQLLLRLADLVECHAAELAALEALDNGKTIGDCLAADLPLAAAQLRYFGGWADKALVGQTTEISGPGTGFGGNHNFFAYTKHDPVGVVGQIIPWNFPLLMLAWKLGPALACGCSVVVKTAEQTPLSALKMAEIIREAGFPPGTVNIISGYGGETSDGKMGPGKALARHLKVDKVAFTGSTEVGQMILKDAADTNLKRTTLELGGKSPNIVFADADFDAAVAGAHVGLFFNQGQCCCAGSRLIVEESIYDRFVAACADAAKARVVGGAFTAGAAQGPQVSIEQLEKVNSLVNSGLDQGARCVAGGKNTNEKPGYFVQPTVFADVDESMKIWNEEIFGPVMSIRKFKTMDEAIEIANNTTYGLAAGVWSKDTNKCQHLVNNLRAGTVWINTYDTFDANAAFGGFKMSGIGRENSAYALRNYTEIKQVTQAINKTW